MVKFFLSVLAQTQKHVFLSVFQRFCTVILPSRAPIHGHWALLCLVLAAWCLVPVLLLYTYIDVYVFHFSCIYWYSNIATNGNVKWHLRNTPLRNEETWVPLISHVYFIILYIIVIQARRAKESFFWPAFVTRILTPRSRKSGINIMGFFWGVDHN